MKKILLKILILMSLVLFACSKEIVEVDRNSYQGQVMMYSSMDERVIIALQRAFEKEYPNVKFKYYYSNIERVNHRLKVEAESYRLNADVIWAGTQIDANEYKKLGYIEKYESKENKNIPKNLVDPDGYFAAARVAIVGLGYGEKGPKNWNDLLNKKYKDKIVSVNPDKASIYKFFIACMMQDKKYGEKYFTKLKENGLVVIDNATKVISQIEDESKIGLVIDQTMKEYVTDEEKVVNFRYSNKDVYVMTTPVCLAKDTMNSENAKLLIDFMLSSKGQKVLTDAGLLSSRKDMKNDYHTEKIIKSAKKIDIDDLKENYDNYSNKFIEIMRGE